MTVHVRYNSWYISLPSLGKDAAKWSISAFSGEREPREIIFNIYISSLRCVLYSVASFSKVKQTQRLQSIARFSGKS